MTDRKAQFEELAKRIATKSLRGALEWFPGNFLNSYQLDLGTGMVIIINNGENQSTPDGTVLPQYTLSFLNERGDTIYMIEAYVAVDTNFIVLKDIYASASESYLRTDDTYKSMMDALSKI